MKCVICKVGETGEGFVNVTLNRGETTVVIKGVPARVCENCDEYYLTDTISEKVVAMGESAVSRNAEIEVLRFAA